MSKNWVDKPTSVRKGEELDNVSLEAYLRDQLSELTGELTIAQFAKGYSNLTYLLKKGDVEMVLRRPPFGSKVKSGHNMKREYIVLKALSQGYSRAPKPIVMCEDESIIGAPFYIMERVKGIILRTGMDREIEPSPELMANIATSFIDALVELHQLDYSALGLRDFGRPEGYVSRQLKGWIMRYQASKTDNIPELEAVTRWLLLNMPDASGHALIHNDFKYDNLVLDGLDRSKVVAILDWEMATIGDPLMDFGTTLGYWIQSDDPEWMQSLALSPTTLPGNPSRSELCNMYQAKSGLDLSDIVFYYSFGVFKIAVIAQQIYYRYKKGLTQDKRFAYLGKAVEGLITVAYQAINKNRLERLF